MAENIYDFYEDLIENIEQTSEELKEANGEERGAITKTYDMQAKTLISYYQQMEDNELNKEKMGLERYKIDEELRLKRDVEECKLAIERSKSNNEKAALWAKVGINLIELSTTIGMGVLYLKANMKYGGMMGKDAQKWFNDLKHIKL